MRNPYLDFCIAVQAARRQAEGSRSPIASACGVAASIYTHQVGNTMRVLTDVRIRHLLADEVGLGKTVQALMILNALRHQRPNLKALVIVPDRLVTQWRDEILTRAHSAPVGEDAREASQYIRLAWESQLGTGDWSLADIDPRRYHILVVDEIHKLTTELQSRINRVSEDMQHLLILTATPSFQDVRRHAQLFTLLEPERSSVARYRSREERGLPCDSDEGSTEIGETEAADIVRSMFDRDRIALENSTEHGWSRAALSDCVYRRVIRTRRADFRGVLPARRHLPQVIEPLEAESERQGLMWRYFEFLDTLSLKLDPVLLAKRVILSPPSLEQRVDFLRRKGHERDGLLEQVKPLVNRKAGDSRVDALVDLLNAIWTANPEERVLVAAQDNLTVDYLYETVGARLAEVGPLDTRRKLVAARIRQGMMTDAVDDLAGIGNETSENLEAFQRGDAIVLFAPEAAQVGLNLQCARVLILYSVPWQPEEVEQWIGRLDRIGNKAAFSTTGAKTIDVYTIVQRGLVDEKVVRVLERFRVFEHSVNLDGKHLAVVSRAIEEAALHPDRVDWNRFESDTERMAQEDSAHDLSSPLQKHLPWTPSAAVALRAALDSATPFQPNLTDSASPVRSGLKSWDRAFEGMLKLLRIAGEYRIRSNADRDEYPFKSLWYSYSEPGLQGQREVLSKAPFSFGPDPFYQRSPENAFCYITRRSQIETPPRRVVGLVLDDRIVDRPLRFLGFGEQLHDELVESWVGFLRDHIGGTINIGLPATHPFFSQVAQPGAIVLRVTDLSPLSGLDPRLEERRSMEAVTAAALRTSRDRVSELILPFISRVRCAIEADSRWLVAQLQPCFSIAGARKIPGGWETIASEAVFDLLNPMLVDKATLASATVQAFSPEMARSAEAGSAFLRGGDEVAAELAWAARLPSFRESTETRISVLNREREDELTLRNLEHRIASERAQAAVERGNKLQAHRAEAEVGLAEDRMTMTRVYWDRRLNWLHRCSETVQSTRPQERAVQVVRVLRASTQA